MKANTFRSKEGSNRDVLQRNKTPSKTIEHIEQLKKFKKHAPRRVRIIRSRNLPQSSQRPNLTCTTLNIQASLSRECNNPRAQLPNFRDRASLLRGSTPATLINSRHVPSRTLEENVNIRDRLTQFIRLNARKEDKSQNCIVSYKDLKDKFSNLATKINILLDNQSAIT